MDGGDLTIGEAATVIGVHKNALRRWTPDTLPSRLVGSRRDRRYAAHDVADYLDRNAHGSRDERPVVARGRLERVRETQEIQRALALAARTADIGGDDELARRLRHVRSVVNQRLRIEDR